MAINKIDCVAAWLYHPDKDTFMGSYEWWYLDAQLENKYVVTIGFSVPHPASEKYHEYRLNVLKGLSLPPFDPKNFCEVSLGVMDRQGNTMIYAKEPVSLERMSLPTEGNLRVKLNDCEFEMTVNDGLPSFTVKMDIKDEHGNVAKANLFYEALVPAATAGRGRTFDAVIDGKHLYDEWVVMASAAKVRGDISIINKENGNTIHIDGVGFGYHDKNWGNHFSSNVVTGWIWTRVAEEDLTIVFAEIPNSYGAAVYPTFQPCIMVHQGKVLTATESLEYVKGKSSDSGPTYPTESTIHFKPESGIKGSLKFYDLSLVYERGPYARLTGRWLLDIESEYGELKRGGKTLLFEYCNFVQPK